MSTDEPTKQAKWRWIEGYRCGCSETADRKKDLPGYCAKHGDSRREVFKLPPKPIEHEH